MSEEPDSRATPEPPQEEQSEVARAADAPPNALKAPDQEAQGAEQGESSARTDASAQGEEPEPSESSREPGEPPDEPSEPSQTEDKPAQEASGTRGRRTRRSRDRAPRPAAHVSAPLHRLVDLSTKYPEIGAPVTELATKLGFDDLARRVMRMGLEGDLAERGADFHRAAADFARREGRTDDALAHVQRGLDAFAARAAESTPDERSRLLHLVRLGFAVLLFDRDDLSEAASFTEPLAAKLAPLASLFEDDPFYHTLVAQALWFRDEAESEAAWDRAVELGSAETSWNARGTWYKEVKKDLAAAEAAYRTGLKALPTSTLLKHNLAQVLMDRAETELEAAPEAARGRLTESEGLLRAALRDTQRRGMRRHISSNIERARTLQGALGPIPKPEPPTIGETIEGRVRSLKPYGAFIALGERGPSGLLHISEMSHEHVRAPSDVVSVGDAVTVKVISVEERQKGDGHRIGLSIRALTPPPEGAARPSAPRSDEARPAPGGNRRARGNDAGSGDNSGGNRGRPGRGRPGASRDQGRGRAKRGGTHRDKRGPRPERGDSPTPRTVTSGPDKPASGGMGSLGEMLLAKLDEQKKRDES